MLVVAVCAVLLAVAGAKVRRTQFNRCDADNYFCARCRHLSSIRILANFRLGIQSLYPERVGFPRNTQ